MTQVAMIFEEEKQQAIEQMALRYEEETRQAVIQAKQQGLRQGTVKTLRNLGYSDKEVEAALKEQYALSEEEAKEYL